jgi:putative endonuclease
MQKQQLGKWGEDLTSKYLQKLGFTILETNFHTRYGEVDIIAREGDELVFIEVRTRSNASYGEAIESITEHKIKSFIKTVETYFRRLHSPRQINQNNQNIITKS